MAGKSNIEWTERTWNPIVGCSIKSPGCKHCYAMAMAARIEAMNAALRAAGKNGAFHYDGTTQKVNGHAVWTGELRSAPDDIWLEPIRRKKPTMWFVNSMGDLFHEDCRDEWIDRAFAIMALCPQHTFQVLTKRADRMHGYLSAARAHPVGMEAMGIVLDAHARDRNSNVGAGVILTGDIAHLKVWPLPNVWLGVSAERQREADERIPLLLKTPAAVRFVSCEPLLEAVDLTRVSFGEGDPRHKRDALAGQAYLHSTGINGHPDLTVRTKLEKPMTRLDWIIVGGESGYDARPFHIEWAEKIAAACQAADVACFVKQLGSAPICGGYPMHLSDLKGGDPKEWPDNLRVRQMPVPAVAKAA